MTFGCHFHADSRLPAKLVNRWSGLCMTLGLWRGDGTRVIVDRCAPIGTDDFDQTWAIEQNATPYRTVTEISHIQAGADRCLDVTDFRDVVGTRLQAFTCQNRFQWNQHFRFLGVDEATCEIGNTNAICGPKRP